MPWGWVGGWVEVGGGYHTRGPRVHLHIAHCTQLARSSQEVSPLAMLTKRSSTGHARAAACPLPACPAPHRPARPLLQVCHPHRLAREPHLRP